METRNVDVTIIGSGSAGLNARRYNATGKKKAFHMLFLDAVYIDSPHGSRARFRWVKAPTSDELTQTLAQRIVRVPEGWNLPEIEVVQG